MPGEKYQLLAPWLACSIGWSCRPMSGRQLAWSAANSRRRGTSLSWSTGDGLRDRAHLNGVDRRDRCSVRSSWGEMALGSMEGHMRTIHGQSSEERRSWVASPLGEELRAYHMALSTAGGPCRRSLRTSLNQAAPRASHGR